MNNFIKTEIAYICDSVKRNERTYAVCGGMGIAKDVSDDDMKREFALHGFIYQRNSSHDSSFTITLKPK